jgi:chitosanase
LGSGKLYFLIKQYCEAPRAKHAQDLVKYLKRLSEKDFTLDTDTAFRGLLNAAGDDPVMRAVQDDFFDRHYWKVAVGRCNSLGAVEPLSAAVVYDSTIHGSWDAVAKSVGAMAPGDEHGWFARYVAARRAWLENHSNTLLAKTVYRMEELKRLIDEGRWRLALPIMVRGLTLTPESLAGAQAIPASAEEKSARVLKLAKPLMKGSDVKRVQRALIDKGFAISDDGRYGNDTAVAVARFQKSAGLKADGQVGAMTLKALVN